VGRGLSEYGVTCRYRYDLTCRWSGSSQCSACSTSPPPGDPRRDSPLDPTEILSPLVGTGAAAEALYMPEATLHRFADARVTTIARGRPPGS